MLFRYLVFKFSHAQFDSDVLYGHIMYRSKCGRWPMSWEELEESGFLAPGVACDYVRSQLYFKKSMCKKAVGKEIDYTRGIYKYIW